MISFSTIFPIKTYGCVIPTLLMICWIFILINPTYEEESSVKADGHVVIGGLLPIHKKFNPLTRQCSDSVWKQIMNAIAMIYAIQMVNQNRSLLPNVTLGYDIRDGCGNNDELIRQLLDITFDVKLQESCQNDNNGKLSSNDTVTTSTNTPKIEQIVSDKVVGIIDGNIDKASSDIQVVAKSLHLPQVSCTATASQFSDKKIFTAFYRTIPPDFQAVPIVLSIVNHFNWKFISLITYTASIANPMHQQAVNLFLASGICIEVNERLARNGNFTLAAINIKESTANIVVILSDQTNLLKLLQEFEKQNVTGKTLVTSCSWSTQILSLNPQIIGGMIGVSLKHPPTMIFLEYLKQVSICHLLKPFLTEKVQQYEEKINSSTTADFTHTCLLLINQTIHSQFIFKNLYNVAYMIDAVYALAHATHKTLNCNPSYCPDLPTNSPSFRDKFSQNLLNVSFTGTTSKLFAFNRVGDPKFTKYYIINSKPKSNYQSHMPFVIGSWQAHNPNPLSIYNSEVGFGPYSNLSYTDIKVLCSPPCQPGSYYQLISKTMCCWRCNPCPPNTVSNQTHSSICNLCPPGSFSDSNGTKCTLTQPILLRYDSTENIIMLTYLTIAVVITFFVWIVLIKYRKTPVVKASDFTLSQMYIIGILMGMLAGVFLAGPVDNTICAITFILFCTSLCFIMSVVLVKTIRISKAFHANFAKSFRTKLFLSRYGPPIVAILLTIMEVIICVVTNHFDPIVVNREVISQTVVYLQCRSSTRIGYFVALGYFFFISIICTYMAFKTRKLPDNFNEAKYISFTTYITLVALITMIPAYLGTSGPFQAAIASFGMITFTLSILLCMFGQRLYIILLQPELNTKENIMLDVATYSFNTVGTPNIQRENYFHTGSARTNASRNSETSVVVHSKAQSS